VYRVARADRAGRLRFAALQGETARRTLPPALVEQVASAAWLDARGLALRSEALLRAWALLPPPWRWLGLLRAVPQPLRDGVYEWVAARRRRLSLGPLELHAPLTAAEQARFLP
jgi:predicted DCC family thiol-disulfide oxidoreductase YuxK